MINVYLPVGSPMPLLQAQIGLFYYCLTNIEADLSIGSTVMTQYKILLETLFLISVPDWIYTILN